MTKTINVTAKDIKIGTPFAACVCPIARALNRALRRTSSVNGKRFRFLGKRTDPDKYYDLPRKARDFVIAFDSRKAVKPFKFKVTI